MIRRSFLKGVGLIGAIDPLQLLAQGEAAAPGAAAPTSAAAPDADRAFWVETLDRGVVRAALRSHFRRR